MKLIIQIPCYNEEDHIVRAIKAIPKSFDGITKVTILVINDASTDSSLKKIKKMPNVKILNLKEHSGLAQVFYKGIRRSLKLGADIIVNYDADLQYCAEEISSLIAPIVQGKAVAVIGERPYLKLKHFPVVKKVLLFIGSKCMSWITGYKIKDPASGFRAYHRDSLKGFKISSKFTYTLESILNFSKSKIPIHTVPLEKCFRTRPSRLIKTNMHYIVLSICTIFATLWRNRFHNDRARKEK